MQVEQIENDYGVNIIKSRIIELTNKRIKLDRDIQHYEARLELCIERKNIEQTKTKIRRLKYKLYETDKMLSLNQRLLGYDDRHEYQLES